MEKSARMELIENCKKCIEEMSLKRCSACETYKKLCSLDRSHFNLDSLKDYTQNNVRDK